MIRLATQADLPFLKHAWKVCFDDPDAFIDWNFAHNFALHDTLIAESDGVAASNLQLMPHRIALRGKNYPVNYVSGVATLPEFRHRGLVRELFGFAFPLMQKRREPISLLVPFNYEFYEKFGYKQCYTKTFRYADTLPDGDCITEVSDGLVASLDRIYRSVMRTRTGYALRQESDWRKILTDLIDLSGGHVRLFPHGYALIAPQENGGWELHEVLGDCSLSVKEEVKPFAMARIIDAKRLLCDFAAEFPDSIRLRVVDPQMAENNLTVRIADGSVTPCDGYDLQWDIQELAQELFGFGTRLLQPQNPYLNMIF